MTIWEDIVRDNRVLVLVGSGGAGKTTTSIAAAILAARMGRRVALLSIDPAQRLAAALGLSLSGSLRRIAIPSESGLRGSIDAAMLDQRAVFDAMVSRYAPTDEVARRILAHPVYVAAATNLSGPLEYMALAKLEELVASQSYDLVILDTPPDTHALEFLDRPNVLAGFMENRVMTWLVRPLAVASRLGLGRVFSAGERMAFGVAKVTGVKALHAFAEFLLLIQEVIEGFHRAGERTLETLKRRDTAFALVVSPTRSSARSATLVAAVMNKLGYKLAVATFNRTLPPALAAALLIELPAAPSESAGGGDPDLDGLKRQAASERVVVEGLTATLRKAAPTIKLCRLPECDADLGSPAGLSMLADHLSAAQP